MAFWETLLGTGAGNGVQAAMQGIGSMVKDVRVAITGDDPLTSEQKAALQQKMMDMELMVTQMQMATIMAEANSKDPWTSRARPTFMYVFYFILLFVGIAAPAMGVFFPSQMAVFFTNIKLGFQAVPDSLYTLFGVGYTGYAVSRTVEKVKNKQ